MVLGSQISTEEDIKRRTLVDTIRECQTAVREIPVIGRNVVPGTVDLIYGDPAKGVFTETEFTVQFCALEGPLAGAIITFSKYGDGKVPVEVSPQPEQRRDSR